MSIRELIKEKKFVVTAELAPPKGTDFNKAYDLACRMADFTDAINITEGQSATMRMNSLALSHLLHERNIETIMQLTCRDQNRIALQSALISACSLGIKNVLCVTGDHVKLGDHQEAKQVFDLDSVSLLQAVNSLNGGYDMKGNPLLGATDLCAGAVINPTADPIEPQLIKMKRKIKAGAQFFQTQPVFSAKLLRPVLEIAHSMGIPVLMGVLVLSSAKMANNFNEKSGIRVPEDILEQLNNSSDPKKTGAEIAARLIDEARAMCQGVHLMGISKADVLQSVVSK